MRRVVNCGVWFAERGRIIAGKSKLAACSFEGATAGWTAVASTFT